MDGQSELDASLRALSAMSITSQPLVETLTQVTRLATRAIPGADGAGLTLTPRRTLPVCLTVASGDLVRALDRAQHRLGEGPCLLAADTRATQVSGYLGFDPRWPRWGPRAAASGVRSALSSPLHFEGRIVGVLSVYAHTRHAFQWRSVRAAEAFRAPAALTVAIADAFEDDHRLVARLEHTLDSRVVINQAIGVLMGQHCWDPDEASDHLRATSRFTGTGIADIARHVVDEATAHARGPPWRTLRSDRSLRRAPPTPAPTAAAGPRQAVGWRGCW